MALVKCKACGNQISKKAKTCPQCGHPNKKPTSKPAGCLALIVVVALVWSISQQLGDGSNTQAPASGGSKTAAVEADDSTEAAYPGPWQEDANYDIVRTLAGKQITGCGELYYRAHARHRSEFLVYCTRDGKQWKAYQVFTRTKDVLGPFIPPKDIAPPY